VGRYQGWLPSAPLKPKNSFTGRGQDRHGEQPGADHAGGEEHERERAEEGGQRLGRLAGGLDVGLAVRMEHGGRGQDDEVHHGL
jgi:hypothetical protein